MSFLCLFFPPNRSKQGLIMTLRKKCRNLIDFPSVERLRCPVNASSAKITSLIFPPPRFVVVVVSLMRGISCFNPFFLLSFLSSAAGRRLSFFTPSPLQTSLANFTAVPFPKPPGVPTHHPSTPSLVLFFRLPGLGDEERRRSLKPSP